MEYDNNFIGGSSKSLKGSWSRKKRVAILGTITDLVSWGYIIHKQAGELICKIGVEVLITIGMPCTDHGRPSGEMLPEFRGPCL